MVKLECQTTHDTKLTMEIALRFCIGSLVLHLGDISTGG